MKKIVSIVLICFAFSCSAYSTEESKENPALQDSALRIFTQLDRDGRYFNDLGEANLNVLPLGIKQTIGNMEFTMAVSHIGFTPTHAELTIFGRLRIPEKDKEFFFAAQKIKYAYSGGFIGNATLALLGDVKIPFNKSTLLTLKGNFDDSTGKGNENLTYVGIECSGFKELSIVGEIQFSDSMMVMVNDGGNPTKKPVTANFQTIVRDWNDLLVDITLPRFQIKGLEGFIFELRDAVFDFSDYRNSSHIKFPTGYKNKYLIPDSPNLWRGVYAREIALTLPKQFSNNDKRAAFEAWDLLIDDNGISGRFEANNVIPIEAGDASGWAFSVDQFLLVLEAHQITEAGFAGLISLPVSEKGNSQLKYKAIIAEGDNYLLNVSMKDSLKFDFLGAEAILKKNSYVKLEVVDGQFKPEACLNGYMDIGLPIGEFNESQGDVKDIEFNELILRTEVPYVKAGYLGYHGEVNLFGFPLAISNLSLGTNFNKLNFGFDIWLNLDEKFVAAKSRIQISSEYIQRSNRKYWIYKGLEISEVRIDNCDIAGIMKLNGSLSILDKHPTYGSGFSGELDLRFSKVAPGLMINVKSAFAKKKDFRYWFVDGIVGFPGEGIPMGVLNLKGFGGGMSNNMRKSKGEGLGLSKTGCGYMPDKNIGLGLKAAVMFGLPAGSMNGDASFEVLFNKNGGLDFIGFYGYAEFAGSIPVVSNLQDKMAGEFKKLVDLENNYIENYKVEVADLKRMKQFEPNKSSEKLTDALEKTQKATMATSLGIQYNLSESSFDANFDFFMNVAGGVVRGTGSGNRAGGGVLHISPESWYLHLGKPSNPVGLAIGIPGIATVASKSYFMMGDQLEDFPGPPSQVADILNQNMESLNSMRDFNALKAGRGLAFGSHLSLNTGDLQCLILYANFKAGVGFDVMLRNYGNVQCLGRSGPVGINGWYASGQAYAFLEGELGVKVNLFLFKGKFPIIKAGTATLLQAQLPNPAWFNGNMGVKFNILGGLVKGNMRFRFSLGDKCDMVLPGSPPINLQMISDLTPYEGSQEQSVYTAPQLALSTPAEENFIAHDESGDPHTYRIHLDKFSIFDGTEEIKANLKWNSDKTLATLISGEVLPPNKKLRLLAEVGFEEYSNEQWKTVYTSGQKSVEKREISFTTGDLPKSFDAERVAYSYPVLDQLFFYPDESTEGYIQLKQGHSHLFPAGWIYEIQFMDNNQTKMSTSCKYDPSTYRISFKIPGVKTSKNYDVELIVRPLKQGSLDVSQKKETTLLKDDDNVVTQIAAQASKVILDDGDNLIFQYQFSSSRYKKFSDKINNMKPGNFIYDLEGPEIIRFRNRIGNIPEYLDKAELYGTPGSGDNPLVVATATLEDNYYKKQIKSLLYTQNPLPERKDVIGIPPVHAVFPYIHDPDKFPFWYTLPKYYYDDFRSLRNKVFSERLSSHPLWNQQDYPTLPCGKYPVLFQYRLPDGKVGSQTQFIFEFTNPN